MNDEKIVKRYFRKYTEGNSEARAVRHKTSKPLSWKRIILYAVLILFAIWTLAPFFIIMVTSFTSQSEWLEATGYIWWPKDFTFEGYERMFKADMGSVNGMPIILSGFLNTMWITLLPLVSGLIQSLLVAYCYWQHRFPFKNTLFIVTVSLMFVPLGAFGFVAYMFYDLLGWTEGFAAVLPLIIPGLFASAGTVFFLRPYLDGIGGEIVEASRIDGMGFWQIFIKIVIPLSKPALIAQFIFGFVGGYNNYAGALLYLEGEPELWTLQLALQQTIANLSSSGGSDYGFICATAIMAMLPLIVLYLGCQKFFIEGIAFGGGKE